MYIKRYAEPYIKNNSYEIPHSHTALVLGALVYKDGRLSHVLYDRLITALDLYKKGKIEKFLLSGDHGTAAYDEVNTMKNFLLKRGVPARDIFLDHAGFNTYNSIVRARNIFQVKNVIIVTQRYHLPRAIYVARKKGLHACGIAADKRKYVKIKYYKKREFFANIKAFIDVLINKKPTFSGEEIPITGDGRESWD